MQNQNLFSTAISKLGKFLNFSTESKTPEVPEVKKQPKKVYEIIDVTVSFSPVKFDDPTKKVIKENVKDFKKEISQLLEPLKAEFNITHDNVIVSFRELPKEKEI